MPMTHYALAAALGVALAGGAVLAASHANPAAEAAVKARKAHMQLYAHNLGILGAMAKGEVDFDAEAAQSAAGNLVMLAGINEASYWVEGSDSMSIDDTRLKPALLDDMGGAMQKVAELGEAARAMQAAAGSLDGVRSTIGAVGNVCGACHEAYREPRS